MRGLAVRGSARYACDGAGCVDNVGASAALEVPVGLLCVDSDVARSGRPLTRRLALPHYCRSGNHRPRSLVFPGVPWAFAGRVARCSTDLFSTVGRVPSVGVLCVGLRQVRSAIYATTCPPAAAANLVAGCRTVHGGARSARELRFLCERRRMRAVNPGRLGADRVAAGTAPFGPWDGSVGTLCVDRAVLARLVAAPRSACYAWTNQRVGM